MAKQLNYKCHFVTWRDFVASPLILFLGNSLLQIEMRSLIFREGCVYEMRWHCTNM